MSRTILLAIGILAIAGVAIWSSVRAGDGVTAAPKSIVAAAAVDQRPREVPGMPRSESVRATLDGFHAWLTETYPRGQLDYLGTDCAEPPCLFGVRFSVDGLGGPGEIRRLLRGVRAEVERRTGIVMSAIHVDEDTAGRGYVWMYGLPGDVSPEQREVLRRSAESRYASHMDPLRKPLEPAVPGKGEPGYVSRRP